MTNVSALILNVFGGPWNIAGGGLQMGDVVLPVQYFRGSLASPMALLIITCATAEMIFLKNRQKIIFICLFVLVFVLSHSMFIAALGGTFEHDLDRLSKKLWDNREWFPAAIFAGVLIITSILIKLWRWKRQFRRV
jgi:hypothetical protein